MKRTELTELHYINPISNLRSILDLGILPYNSAKAVRHVSVADEQVQERRAKVRIPGPGRPLHDYVNLYFDARNPMMFLRKSVHKALCVLGVSPAVLDLPGVIITDGNAASDYTSFRPSPGGLEVIDRGLVYARSWIHSDDEIATWRHKSAKCAEVLVPDRVSPDLVCKVYVSCPESRDQVVPVLAADIGRVGVVVDGDMFFA